MTKLTDKEIKSINILIQALIKGKRFRIYSEREWHILESMLKYLKW